MIESHASLFGLKFWTFILGDNRPTLEPVFGVGGRSTTVLTLRIQQMKRAAPTFSEFAEHAYMPLIKLAKQFKSKRIDFVTDRYPEVSIKKIEQNRNASTGMQKIKIVGAN